MRELVFALEFRGAAEPLSCVARGLGSLLGDIGLLERVALAA